MFLQSACRLQKYIVVLYKRLRAVEVFLCVFRRKKHKRSRRGGARRRTRGAGNVGVEEDAGDVEHFRRHLDAVVDVGEVGDERRDRPADVFMQSVIRIAFAAR